MRNIDTRITTMRDLLTDTDCCKSMMLVLNCNLLEYSRQGATLGTLNKLFSIAEAADVKEKINRMFNGVRNRSVLHVALCAPRDAVINSDGKSVVPDVWSLIRSGSSLRASAVAWVGATGKPLKDVVAIGIGGSSLGPLFVHTALQTDPELLNLQEASFICEGLKRGLQSMESSDYQMSEIGPITAKIKQEAEQFRQWRASQEKELLQLKIEGRRNEYERHKLQALNQRQKIVLQRKTEEATMATKRLNELLDARKSSVRGSKYIAEEVSKELGIYGNEKSLQRWLDHELDVLVNVPEVIEYEKQGQVYANSNKHLADEMSSQTSVSNLYASSETAQVYSIPDASVTESVAFMDLTLKAAFLHLLFTSFTIHLLGLLMKYSHGLQMMPIRQLSMKRLAVVGQEMDTGCYVFVVYSSPPLFGLRRIACGSTWKRLLVLEKSVGEFLYRASVILDVLEKVSKPDINALFINLAFSSFMSTKKYQFFVKHLDTFAVAPLPERNNNQALQAALFISKSLSVANLNALTCTLGLRCFSFVWLKRKKYQSSSNSYGYRHCFPIVFDLYDNDFIQQPVKNRAVLVNPEFGTVCAQAVYRLLMYATNLNTRMKHMKSYNIQSEDSMRVHFITREGWNADTGSSMDFSMDFNSCLHDPLSIRILKIYIYIYIYENSTAIFKNHSLIF
ncbi:hypothetical protein ACH5RR_024821 [Cinchona calisaya]|uniref:Uncharacterized protein n=1 Tax=Cinchona calisaya TaxID=153742 RepID=A0ABD2YYY4_9GENT